MLSNAASWSIFAAVFLLLKPRQASFSSIRRQRRTCTWLWYDDSIQETSRRKKYGHEDFIKRHLGKQCSTKCYSNPAELICKTIEYVIRILRNNGRGVQNWGIQPDEFKFILFDCGQQQKNILVADNENGLKDKTERSPNTKGDAIKASRVNLQDNRIHYQNLAKQWTRRAKSGRSARRNSDFYCLTAVKNKKISERLKRIAVQKQKEHNSWTKGSPDWRKG